MYLDLFTNKFVRTVSLSAAVLALMFSETLPQSVADVELLTGNNTDYNQS
jgi:hypothetical protein